MSVQLKPFPLEAGYSCRQVAVAGHTVISQALQPTNIVHYAGNSNLSQQQNISNTFQDNVASPYRVHATT